MTSRPILEGSPVVIPIGNSISYHMLPGAVSGEKNCRATLIVLFVLVLFVHVLNVVLEQQHSGFRVTTYADGIFVVPIDCSLNRLAILKHDNHWCLVLYLLHIIEVLGIGLLI